MNHRSLLESIVAVTQGDPSARSRLLVFAQSEMILASDSRQYEFVRLWANIAEGLNSIEGTGEGIPSCPPPTLVFVIEALKLDGWNQKQIIETIWGAKSGGSKAYADALRQYRELTESVACAPVCPPPAPVLPPVVPASNPTTPASNQATLLSGMTNRATTPTQQKCRGQLEEFLDEQFNLGLVDIFSSELTRCLMTMASFNCVLSHSDFSTIAGAVLAPIVGGGALGIKVPYGHSKDPRKRQTLKTAIGSMFVNLAIGQRRGACFQRVGDGGLFKRTSGYEAVYPTWGCHQHLPVVAWNTVPSGGYLDFRGYSSYPADKDAAMYLTGRRLGLHHGAVTVDEICRIVSDRSDLNHVERNNVNIDFAVGYCEGVADRG